MGSRSSKTCARHLSQAELSTEILGQMGAGPGSALQMEELLVGATCGAKAPLQAGMQSET